MGKPNFVIFLTDDQGYWDLSCMGATDFRTPNLDRLAATGVRFTDWYSNSPVCSPSRASLLTGRYPANAGVRGILKGHRTTSGLLPEVPTIASALKELGYRTAMFGKWHLGSMEECRPHNHGFDHWFGHLGGTLDYYSHNYYWESGRINPTHDLWENNEEIWDNGAYMTHMIADRAVHHIRNNFCDGKPFFLYVPFNAPHQPMHAPQEYMDRFRDLPWERRVMAAMLSAMDDGVGDILNELERQGLADNTCVLFMSDNGPCRETVCWLNGSTEPYRGGSAGFLKGHKFSLFDGGVRVPAILRWPGVIPAGCVTSEVGAAMDVFPTFLKAAGGDPGKYDADGSDILPMVSRGEASPHRELFWEMGKQTAVRRGKWKLVLNGILCDGVAPDDAVFLSDMQANPGETVNLKDSFPELVAELTASAEAWRSKIEDRWSGYWLPRHGRTGDWW